MSSEREQMAEDIRRSLEAIKRAHASGEALKREPNHETLHAYQQEIRSLVKELKALNYLVHHEIEATVDDIGDLIHRALTGQKAPYRHSPELHKKEEH